MENPHEVKQRRLVKRIIHSVGRLNEVLNQINGEMSTLKNYTEDIKCAHAVWQGYERKVNVYFDSEEKVHGKQ